MSLTKEGSGSEPKTSSKAPPISKDQAWEPEVPAEVEGIGPPWLEVCCKGKLFS